MKDAASDLTSVSLADEESVRKILTESVFGLWDVVNNLTRLRPSRRDRYRVTIFGSARATETSFAYHEVRRVAEALSAMDCDVITGGGPGLMRAANEGAAQAGKGGQSVGIRIDLPFEQDVNPFVTDAFTHRTFFTRLHQFVLMSDAYVVAPGGIGTVLELMLVWQLMQVKHVQNAPLILVGKMWSGLVEWAREAFLQADHPLVNPEDLAIPQCVESADEAIAILNEFHARWTGGRSPSQTS
jgi:uncharacterized protein (TIGR00730 family)